MQFLPTIQHCDQCDQILKLKVAHVFPKVASKVDKVAYALAKNVIIKVGKKLSPRPFKKRPIWPHWLPWNFEVSRMTKGIVIGRTLCKPHTTFNKSTPR